MQNTYALAKMPEETRWKSAMNNVLLTLPDGMALVAGLGLVHKSIICQALFSSSGPVRNQAHKGKPFSSLPISALIPAYHINFECPRSCHLRSISVAHPPERASMAGMR